jgi:hypothetical protein
MKARTPALANVVITALISAIGPITLARGAESVSSPTEQAATAKLNSDIATRNVTADQQFELHERQYEKQKMENDALQQQYQDAMKNYALRETQYQEEKRQNDALEQQYEVQLKAYQALQGSH